jgi:ABC-2 type transport system ATP-binding protein
MNPMNAIETHALSRTYGRHEALHGLDIQVPHGSVFALLGSNGAGKTTTIKLLMNRIFPTSGEARILGVPSVKLMPPQFQRIGYVSESQILPSWMSVRQFLDYCRPFYPNWDRKLESELLSRFALPGDRKLGELSRGMKMKTALVSALAYRPSLLVLDEPFSGLDPLVRDEFTRGLLAASSAEECTIFVSSHDIDDIARMVDHVALLDAGRLTLSEPVDGLTARFRMVEVSGGTPGGPHPAGALDREVSGGLTQFVAPDYAAGKSEATWQQQFPGAEITSKAMTLREIVLTLIRTARLASKGVL